MFGGMPAFLINVAYPAQIVKRTVGQVVKLIDTPAAFLFFAMTAMWLMLLVFGVDPWVGIIPALAYGLSTYFLLIIGAGHITKMWALVYAPLMMGGAWMTLRGNMWAGGALTALTASLEIGANHPQITYYFLLAMAAFWISEGIAALRDKRLGDLLETHGGTRRRRHTRRRVEFLAPVVHRQPLQRDHARRLRTGLDLRDFAGRADARLRHGLELRPSPESFNLFIPNLMGGSSAQPFSPDGPVAEVLANFGARPADLPIGTYWATSPVRPAPPTSAPRWCSSPCSACSFCAAAGNGGCWQ